MSKASELRLIRGQRSADAAINYHHRSGDSEGSGGSMLDFYAQEESAEEAYLEEQEESAGGVFACVPSVSEKDIDGERAEIFKPCIVREREAAGSRASVGREMV